MEFPSRVVYRIKEGKEQPDTWSKTLPDGKKRTILYASTLHLRHVELRFRVNHQGTESVHSISLNPFEKLDFIWDKDSDIIGFEFNTSDGISRYQGYRMFMMLLPEWANAPEWADDLWEFGEILNRLLPSGM